MCLLSLLYLFLIFLWVIHCRLERLLLRRKFEAAESLAKNFGLDMTPVHIARVQNYLGQMQPWNHCKSRTSDDNKELLQCILNELDKISVSWKSDITVPPIWNWSALNNILIMGHGSLPLNQYFCKLWFFFIFRIWTLWPTVVSVLFLQITMLPTLFLNMLKED